MTEYFTVMESGFDCSLEEYKDIMSNIDVVHLVEYNNEFYRPESHPEVHDVMQNNRIDFTKDNPQYVVYEFDNSYHCYVERTDDDLIGWVIHNTQVENYSDVESSLVETTGSIPHEYLNSERVPFKDFEKLSSGRIKDIDKDDPERVLKLLLDNVVF